MRLKDSAIAAPCAYYSAAPRTQTERWVSLYARIYVHTIVCAPTRQPQPKRHVSYPAIWRQLTFGRSGGFLAQQTLRLLLLLRTLVCCGLLLLLMHFATCWCGSCFCRAARRRRLNAAAYLLGRLGGLAVGPAREEHEHHSRHTVVHPAARRVAGKLLFLLLMLLLMFLLLLLLLLLQMLVEAADLSSA